MRLQLPIIPSFLQQRLSFTRSMLLGNAEFAIAATNSGAVALVSARHRRSKKTVARFFWQTVGYGIQGLVITAAIGLLLWWWGPLLWSKISGTTNPTLNSFVNASITQATQLVTGWGKSTPPAADVAANLISVPIAGQSGQGDFINNLQEPPTTHEFAPADSNDRYLPEINPDLPVGDWLIISKIGVRSQLQSPVNFEDALKTGLWRAPDFGKPGSTQLPMIVAGHRYGWKWWWKDDYWKYNSFYLLPELQAGDRVEVISEQRKWTYEIYAVSEGDEITDYDADLILYTCKYLQSPLRFFRYAKLMK